LLNSAAGTAAKSIKTSGGTAVIEKIRQEVENNRQYLAGMISEMVRFGSYSGEAEEIQLYLKHSMDELGMETRLVKVVPEKLERYKGFSYDGFSYDRRYSLLGLKKGVAGPMRNNKPAGRSLILNGHVDIVPPGDLSRWSDDPLSGKYVDGKVYGRGSLDMKGGLAAGITAIKVLQDLRFSNLGDITVASVCGEETGGCGAFALVEDGISADGCIILEPTRLKICHIQSGCHTFKISLRGLSIHACMAYKGVDVIDKFAIVYEALKEMDKKRHERFVKSSSVKAAYYENNINIAPLNVGTIQAGEWPSSVPDYLQAHGRVGIFPGETVEDMHWEFEETVQAAAKTDPWLKENPPLVEWYEGLFEPAETAVDSELLTCLAANHREMIGREAGFEAVTYGSDMRIFSNYAAVPTVLYGPGDVSLAHTVNEHVIIEDVMEAVYSIIGMLVNWCGGEFKK
jgi:acetylornithine deacetylase